MPKYDHVILGGTFDHFHLGHQSIIREAFALGQKVTLGVSQENLYQKKFLSSTVEDYETRQQSVEGFLKSKGWWGRGKIISIDDIYGTSKSDPSIKALIATQTTYANALKVNQKRSQLGFQPLEIITVPFVKGDDGQVITSERIRLGEIDRKGHSYLKIFSHQLTLPEHLREKLRQPIGQVLTKTQLINQLSFERLISVGDFVTASLLGAGIDPDVKIIDFKIRRQVVNEDQRKLFVNRPRKHCVNQAGTINSQAVNALWGALGDCLKGKKQLLVVDGEEDLLALPAILLSPLKSTVIYGQKDLGAVVVEVNEETKTTVEKILKQFSSLGLLAHC